VISVGEKKLNSSICQESKEKMEKEEKKQIKKSCIQHSQVFINPRCHRFLGGGRKKQR
jgi:hypothetical protein